MIGTPRKVSFDDDERFGLEGEIFVPSTKSHDGQSKTRGEDDYLSKEGSRHLKRALNQSNRAGSVEPSCCS